MRCGARAPINYKYSGEIASHEGDGQYVLLEGGALFEARVPAFEIGELWLFGGEAAEAVGDEGDRDVAHREPVARDIGALAKLRVEHFQRGVALLARGVDRGHVALLRRG